ncbi:MAG: hypothetical protein SFY80_16850 [Verrucomicrobiota bacterium]|nr:hypothetical protein [Verrucomicrobiota bacterium]
MKTTIAIIVGYAVWTAFWLGGNAGFRAFGITPRDPSSKIESSGTLLALLVLSVFASVAAGYLSGLIASGKAPAYICAGLLLATGIAVQLGVRSLFPIWYHATFLLLLVPVFLLGSSFVKGS